MWGLRQASDPRVHSRRLCHLLKLEVCHLSHKPPQVRYWTVISVACRDWMSGMKVLLAASVLTSQVDTVLCWENHPQVAPSPVTQTRLEAHCVHIGLSFSILCLWELCLLSEHGLHLGRTRVTSITFIHKWCPVLSFRADTDCLGVKTPSGNNSKKENDCLAWKT